MTSTYTYSVADIETVFRRFSSDILMIADSTRAISREKALNYIHDAEYLAKNGFLNFVDVTLLSNGIEKQAAQYVVNESSGNIESSRPGGVMWIQVPWPELRVILGHSPAFTADQRVLHQSRLKFQWFSTNIDTSHITLSAAGSRSYVSNVYGLQRKDFA